MRYRRSAAPRSMLSFSKISWLIERISRRLGNITNGHRPQPRGGTSFIQCSKYDVLRGWRVDYRRSSVEPLAERNASELLSANEEHFEIDSPLLRIRNSRASADPSARRFQGNNCPRRGAAESVRNSGSPIFCVGAGNAGRSQSLSDRPLG